MQAAAVPSTQLDDLSQNTPWLRKIKAACSWLTNYFDNKFKQLVRGGYFGGYGPLRENNKANWTGKGHPKFFFFFLIQYCSFLGWIFFFWKTTFHSPSATGGTNLSCLWDVTQNHAPLINQINLLRCQSGWNVMKYDSCIMFVMGECLPQQKVSWRGKNLCVMYIL